ncbi:MAG: hypothetical protein MJY79_03865 [Bacteroidaceae bacterium]|nr:hypothetical protein [Bacteroidaceae bacterium]
MKEKYDWKFSTIGGVTRVNIESGADIAHLDELDQKLWTVLSCPVKGLEFDEKTLQMIDTNSDGKIHVNEVVAAAKWLTSVLKDADLLVKEGDSIPLSAFNTECADGKKLKVSAQQILKNLGKDKQEISVADTSDSLAIFAQTRFNGDGIITEGSTDDEDLKKVIAFVKTTMGTCADRSGQDGVNADQIEAFYTACADYAAWKDAAEQDKANVFPYADSTDAALAACNAVKEKIADYFMRCKLAAFNGDSASTLDVSAERIGAISAKNLAECNGEISEYPLAKVSADLTLPLDVKLINPAWQGAFATLKSLVLDAECAGKDSISEAEWGAVLSKFGAYTAWTGAKKGDAVESLGLDTIKAVLAADQKAQLLELVAQDKALEEEAGSIEAVDKLLHLRRDFFTLLKNYVSLRDFYSPDAKAIFQAGTLYIDQRSCDFCMKVANMGNHNAMAGLSGMYLIYCDCTCKQSAATMQIVAAMTDGDIENLRVGKNAIFYDRNGLDWDATVTKIVDNPISIRQAFWSPYRKMGQFVENQINKFAAEKDAKVTSDATAKIAAAPASVQGGEAATAAKPAFDIAKFAGIFAAIGMALGMLGSALAAIFTGFISLKLWQMVLVVVMILLVISGPSMLLAWMKLRKRDISSLLNANGWAINAKVKVNVPFGNTLTKMANLPVVTTGVDPFAEKKTSGFVKFLYGLLVIACVVFAVLCKLQKMPWQQKTSAETPTEQVDENIVPETPAGTSLEEMTGAE